MKEYEGVYQPAQYTHTHTNTHTVIHHARFKPFGRILGKPAKLIMLMLMPFNDSDQPGHLLSLSSHCYMC